MNLRCKILGCKPDRARQQLMRKGGEVDSHGSPVAAYWSWVSYRCGRCGRWSPFVAGVPKGDVPCDRPQTLAAIADAADADVARPHVAQTTAPGLGGSFIPHRESSVYAGFRT